MNIKMKSGFTYGQLSRLPVIGKLLCLLLDRLMYWMKDTETKRQMIRYLITGFITFGVEYSSFFILYNIVGLKWLYANIIVYVTVFWLNFFANRKFSFKSKESLRIQIPKYGILFIINLFATNILMGLFSDILMISPNISKILVMGFVVSWNFILYKKVIYK